MEYLPKVPLKEPLVECAENIAQRLRDEFGVVVQVMHPSGGGAYLWMSVPQAEKLFKTLETLT